MKRSNRRFVSVFLVFSLSLLFLTIIIAVKSSVVSGYIASNSPTVNVSSYSNKTDHNYGSLHMSSANLKPSMQIILIIHTFRDIRNHLLTLFESLRDTDFNGDAVNLEIFLVNQSFGLTRPHSEEIETIISSFNWPHGKVWTTIVSRRDSPHYVLSAWRPAHNSPEFATLIDFERVLKLPKYWYRYIASVRKDFAKRPDVFAFAIEPVEPNGRLLSTYDTKYNKDVFLWEGMYSHGVFVPASIDKWLTFQNWLQRRRNDWYLWPTASGIRRKNDERWGKFNSTVLAPWPHWVSRFCAQYNTFTLYPRRKHPSVLPKHVGNEKILKLSLNGLADSSEVNSRISETSVDKIVKLAEAHNRTVSLTLANGAFLEFAKSWICNVNVGGFRPPGIVWITIDQEAYDELKYVPGSYIVRMNEIKGGDNGSIFGKPAYWLLMLERAYLIRDLLNRGVNVFLFETDQVWLRDPMPYVRELASGDEVDFVGTFNAFTEIEGNFLYFKPTLSTRKMYNEVCRQFENSFSFKNISTLPNDSHVFVFNDQTILTSLVLYDEHFRSKYPVVFRMLDRELFVSGQWYGRVSFYNSSRSQSPVIINNNWIMGMDAKIKRLKKFKQYFLKEGKCDEESVRYAIRMNENRRTEVNLDRYHTQSGFAVNVEAEANIETVVDATAVEMSR